ncbi:MAG TPA: YceI family protein [Cyclobacteriaceae bacterium]
MRKIKFLSAAFLLLTTGFLVIQCQHDDETAIPVVGPDPIERGTEIMTCTSCNTTPAGSGIWYLDKAHSNVMWETRYKVFGSKLTGRFDSFFMDNLNFDEANPANITFEGHVWLNTVNTSEPGRDDGCLLTSFKTDGDNTTEAENYATLKAIAGTGKYSTSDDGFLIDADFTFLGITKQVTVKMYFAPRFDIGTAFAAGLNTEFEIATDDFLPNDTNIGDIVRIEMNTLMRIKK